MSDTKLFEAFSDTTAQQWIAQAVKDLKGASFEEQLQYQSADGITIQPFYTAEDIKNPPPLFTHTDWEITEGIFTTDETAANKKLLHALNNGSTALRLEVNDNTDFHTLFSEVQLPYIGLLLNVSGSFVAFAERFNDYLQNSGYDTGKLNIGINADVINAALNKGNWRTNSAEDMQEWKHLFQNTGICRTLCIDATALHNAGASPAFQLGCILAMTNEYIHYLGNNGITHHNIGHRIQINVATGPDYFFEIAKLRSLRKLMVLLLQQYGISGDIYIHTTTAFRNLTVYDAYNNLLRTTTEAMAATIGGCNSLEILPFDAAFNEPNEFAQRMARNIQLILKAESHFDKVADAGAGSYFIEMLTEQLGEKAWNYFKEIETEGGFITAMEANLIQEKTEAFAAAQQQRFNEGKELLVGTNKFPNPSDLMQEKRPFKNQWTQPATATTFRALNTTRLAVINEQDRVTTEKTQA